MPHGPWEGPDTPCPHRCNDDSFPGPGPTDDCDGHPRRLTVKAPVVIAEETFQKVGTVEITAPPGISVDPKSGHPTHPMHLELVGPPVFRPVVLEDKLVNEGFLRAKLVTDDADPHVCADARKPSSIQVVIPLQSIHDIKGIRPGDHVQEMAEIEGLLVTATPELCTASGNTVKLVLKAILRVSVVVSRECIIAVPAKVLRCLPPCQVTA